ncbi:MAG: peptidoglycan DD-metalloendopeptidase family protein [Ignavibacteriales bacterium]|nr:peptidoglycan DD-metalloendopeptidase family protein [Ignavibacteriales bacterium]
MKSLLVFLVLSAFLAPFSVYTYQAEKEIKKKSLELDRLRNEIQAFEKKLKESEKRERSTLERLDNLERQSNLIRQLIRKLREEEEEVTTEISRAKSSIRSLENQLQFLKTHYAGYVRSVYKNGRVYDVELLFSSNSINQMYIRMEYLKRFSEQRAKDLGKILDNKSTLERQNDELQVKLAAERKVLSEKTREETTLRKKYSEREQVLSRIRKDKKTFQRGLARKTEAAQQIERLIADLIEKERIRKEKEAEEKRHRELAEAREREKLRNPASPPLASLSTEAVALSAFEQRRGRLRWPVSSGAIHSRFGDQVHPVLRTVTQNTGIDIQVSSGSNVLAVADGEVSVLSFIPGFGNVLILNHYDGYRTVYAHLSDISVVESEKVREGEVIAKSGDSIAGSVLHFEIWKEREKQDPERWLTKRK